MDNLFTIEPKYPEGFSYNENFISHQEERELLAFVKTIPVHTFIFQGYEAKRKVKSFGMDYSFDKRQISPGEIIPSEFDTLIQKVAEHVNIKEEDFKELLVTEYPPGAVINWHRDAPPFDVIAGISLHSKCTFKLRPHDKLKQGRKTMVSLTIEPRSLYVIKGVARTDWEHSTAPVEQTRYSITLRTLRKM